MPSTIEKLSPREKASLSKETILAWHKARNREKLDSLKDEVKQLAYGDREKLRQTIIDNTKRDLQRHRQLTAAQREEHAKQFADDIIKAIIRNENLDDVINRYETMARIGGREALIKAWTENNPDRKIEKQTDDPRYLALKEIPDNMMEIRNEAAGLLHLYEKFLGTRQQALELYRKCWRRPKLPSFVSQHMHDKRFDIEVLRKEFSRTNTLGKTGFYYGTRKIYWERTGWTASRTIEERIRNAGFTSSETGRKERYGPDGVSLSIYTTIVNVTGWWAHDIDDKYPNGSVIEDRAVRLEGGGSVQKDILYKLQHGAGYGDEWLGKTYKDATNEKTLKAEIGEEARKKNFDSGLDPDREDEILKEVKAAEELNRTKIYKNKAATDLFTWLSANAGNKWAQLPEKENGLMTFLYGAGCGNYLYRYSSKKEEVYFLRIDGAGVDARNFGGKITVKDKNALDKREIYNTERTERMLKEIADNLTAQEVNEELLNYRLKHEKPEQITESDKLDMTKGLAAGVFGTKSVEYKNIQKDYIDKLTEKLEEELKKRNISNDRAKDLAEMRASAIKAEVYKKIEEDEILDKAVKDDENIKLEIKVDSGDRVTVKFADTGLERRLRGDAEKEEKDKEDAKSSPGALEENYMKQLEQRISKYAGRFTPIVMYFIDKIFKVRDKVKDMASGKPSMLTAVLTFFGVKTGKEAISTRKMTEKRFEKLPPGNKKTYSLTRKMVFEEAVTLKNKKIVIPKGKGFVPGGKMKLKLDGRYAVEYDPEKEKKEASKGQTGLMGLFNRFRKEKEQYKDHEITIEPDTVIPAKTEIPRGARIEKV